MIGRPFFLGASYFRAIGDDWQYGLSARGVMVNAAEAGISEEFPPIAMSISNSRRMAARSSSMRCSMGPSLTVPTVS